MTKHFVSREIPEREGDMFGTLLAFGDTPDARRATSFDDVEKGADGPPKRHKGRWLGRRPSRHEQLLARPSPTESGKGKVLMAAQRARSRVVRCPN